jgi:hypothetical protein
MSGKSDELYIIFENQLFTAIVEEESNDEFIARVVNEYANRLSRRGVIPLSHRESILADLHDEVLTMLRKRTYGHYNLAAFRKAQSNKPASAPSKETQILHASLRKEKARRHRRAC